MTPRQRIALRIGGAALAAAAITGPVAAASAAPAAPAVRMTTARPATGRVTTIRIYEPGRRVITVRIADVKCKVGSGEVYCHTGD
jgi:hypothetical protein